MKHTAWAMVIMAFLASACASPASRAEAEIAAIVKSRLAQPGVTLIVEPIAVDGAFAVADWTRGDSGGRALLQKGAKGWLLVLCGGDSLRTIQGLMRLGVPDHQAAAIVKELAREERQLSAGRLAAMARFSGEVRM